MCTPCSPVTRSLKLSIHEGFRVRAHPARLFWLQTCQKSGVGIGKVRPNVNCCGRCQSRWGGASGGTGTDQELIWKVNLDILFFNRRRVILIAVGLAVVALLFLKMAINGPSSN